MHNNPKVLILTPDGRRPVIQGSSTNPWYECKDFTISYAHSDESLSQMYKGYLDEFDVIITVGKDSDWPTVWRQPYYIRRKWIAVEEILDVDESIGEMAYRVFINNLLERRKQLPKVSVFTCTHNTPWEKISRLYNALLAQDYQDWEWVIYDDSNPLGKTDPYLYKIYNADSRIKLYRAYRHSSIIGHNKRAAAMLCTGEILAEIDHDDYIMPNTLSLLVKGYQEYPDCGFYYTDCTEVHENGECITYGEGFAFGYGKYRTENYQGKDYIVYDTPPINPITIRHIVGVPNHIRAWKADVYRELDGHNPRLYVADDYELIVRTFLKTRFLHIPSFNYIQYYDVNRTSNTQDIRRSEIQRLVRHIQGYYDDQISKRIEELGQEDWMREYGYVNWNAERKHTEPLNLIMTL